VKGALVDVKEVAQKMLSSLGDGWTVKVETNGKVIFSQEKGGSPFESFDLQMMTRCSKCKKIKPDVRKREDPFESEMSGSKKKILLCDQCAQDSANEI
jgi:hypothetical protein